MINQRVEEAINKQIQAELYSSYLYMAMSAHANQSGLPGMAQWLKVQVQEEMTHALRFYQYLNNRGGHAVFYAIEQPPSEFPSAVGVFEHVLKHEQHVTSLINGLMDVAMEERDHATTQMLQWFVTEQVEEEANAMDILQKLKLIGDTGNALFLMDKELAMRTFVPPADMVI